MTGKGYCGVRRATERAERRQLRRPGRLGQRRHQRRVRRLRRPGRLGQRRQRARPAAAWSASSAATLQLDGRSWPTALSDNGSGSGGGISVVVAADYAGGGLIRAAGRGGWQLRRRRPRGRLRGGPLGRSTWPRSPRPAGDAGGARAVRHGLYRPRPPPTHVRAHFPYGYEQRLRRSRQRPRYTIDSITLNSTTRST